jgi:hypothetical protein
MKAKISILILIAISAILFSCKSGTSGLYMQKGDDGYVMFNNSLKLDGLKIIARYQKTGYTINNSSFAVKE